MRRFLRWLFPPKPVPDRYHYRSDGPVVIDPDVNELIDVSGDE
ncbi:hypothetical protein [Arthrobacter alpinus]|nr:hypothetical protein [Arthrobacter alpinus]